MYHLSVIITLLIIIILISFYVFYSDPPVFRGFRGFSELEYEPFDNFLIFNDLEVIENSNCQPFVVRPKQADLLGLIAPEIFSCNSPMGHFADFDVDSGTLTISDKLITKRLEGNDQNYTCVYTEIVKVGEHPVNGTLVSGAKEEFRIEPGNPTKIPLEQFVVYCRDPTGSHFYNKTFFNFKPKIEAKKHENDKNQEDFDNLIVLSISGMSHNQAMRHLKGTLEFAAGNEFQSFSMFNQEPTNLGSGTSEMIWNVLKSQHNWTTFLQTDSRTFGEKYGSDFAFFPEFYNFYNQQHLAHVENCISDGRVVIEDSVALWTNFSKIFSSENNFFALLHFTEISKNSDGRLENLDEPLKNALKELLENGILKNTTVVFMSEGGNFETQISKTTESGYLESKYGLFMIRLSDNFRKKNPKKVEMFQGNVDRLIIIENIIETLKELVTLDHLEKVEKSLLSNRISADTGCKEAGIDEKFCICSEIRILNEETQKSITELLKKAIENEVSSQKCLEKVEISMDFPGKFRISGNINFFKFHVILTTGRVKLSKEADLAQRTFKFHGIARFYTEKPENPSSLRISYLELTRNLKNSNSTGFPLDR